MKRMLLFASICLLTGSLLWAADPPLLINYQGVLRDAAGKPLSGTYDMAFSFYDAAASGNLLLTDTHSGGAAVTVAGGLFNAALGSGALSPPTTPFLSVFANHTNVWLEVRIGGETLSPRVQVVSAAYAQSAHTLDGYDAVSFAAASHAHDASAVTSGTLGAARGGTGLAGPGDSGNVLMSNGSTWVSNGLPTGATLGAIMGASDTTLTKTGSAIPSDPYKLKLNLGNANTWTGAQTFGGATNFPGPGIWDSTGKVGIGTSAPDSPLQLFYTQASHGASTDNRGVHLSAVAFPENLYSEHDYFWGLDCAVNGASGVDADMYQSLCGIRASTIAPANWHEADIVGVEANVVGGHLATGLNATASGGGGNVGVEGHASGSVGIQYGVQGDADGTAATTHIGVLGGASGGSINWAGYFSFGNVYIKNYLGIGTSDSSPPAYPLDVQAAFAVGRFTTTGDTNGAVIELKNTTSSPTLLGAINFSTSLGYPGQMAYHGGDYFTFNAAGAEKVRVGGTYSLQLFADYAAKPGTNTWTIASDGRLKKDIVPFKDGLAVIEKINPISYRYNGLGGTPADMPGIGVIAQEIRNVAPYTVGTFKAKMNEKDESATDLLNFNSHALTFVMINAIKELDERTKSLVKDTESKDSADKKSAASADAGESYAESGLLVKTTERSAQAKPSDVFQDELGNVYGRSFRPSLPEVATFVPAAEPIEAGDLLVADDLLLGQVRLSTVSGDPRVLGIATGEPGVCLGGRGQSGGGVTGSTSAKVPVALSGIVVCKADASAGPIAVGDLLTTSSAPGHAMRATNPAPGTVVGKALEPLASGAGLIKVLVMLR